LLLFALSHLEFPQLALKLLDLLIFLQAEVLLLRGGSGATLDLRLQTTDDLVLLLQLLLELLEIAELD
jgi:hypothetical protein